MSEQPEALRLADAIDPLVRQLAPDHLTSKVAAAELRRLHEAHEEACGENIRLQNEIDRLSNHNEELRKYAEHNRQRANEYSASWSTASKLNQELLEALKQIAGVGNKMWGHDWEEIDEARVIARTAIAKAEGETK